MSGNPEQSTDQEPLSPERTNKIVDKFSASLTNYTSDATTRDRLGAKLTDAKQGLFGGDMTVKVEHNAFGLALKSEYKDGFSQRSVIGRQGGVFDNVVVPDHEGRITNQDALDAFEILADALYAEMYEQLATASPAQGDLLSALDSLTELGVASPQIADTMRISQPTIELYRTVLSMRSERPGPPDRRGDVDAQVDQTYITELVAEKNAHWQRALDAETRITQLEQDIAIRDRDNARAFAEVGSNRQFRSVLSAILDGQEPQSADLEGLSIYMLAELDHVQKVLQERNAAQKKVTELEEAARDHQVGIIPEVKDRHQVDQTAALSLAGSLSAENPTQKDLEVAIESGRIIGMSESQLQSVRRSIRSRMKSVLPREDDEATPEEVKAFKRRTKFDDDDDAEGPMAVALRAGGIREDAESEPRQEEIVDEQRDTGELHAATDGLLPQEAKVKPDLTFPQVSDTQE